jgi:hypothetical protein
MMEEFDRGVRRNGGRFAALQHIQTLSRREYSFRSLPPTIMDYGIETGTAIHLEITPPFWSNNWMLIIYIGLILGAILLIRTAVLGRNAAGPN